MRSTAAFVFVFLSVCPLAYLKNYVLHVAVAVFSSNVSAIRHALPVCG